MRTGSGAFREPGRPAGPSFAPGPAAPAPPPASSNSGGTPRGGVVVSLDDDDNNFERFS